MRWLFSQFLVMLVFFACAQTDGVNFSVEDRVQKLNTYYPGASAGDLEDKQSFFDAFPRTFDQFQLLYGFDDVEGAAPLYDNAVDHIPKLFFRLGDAIPKERFLQKIVSIAIGGRWDADAVNYFQRGLRQTVMRDVTGAAAVIGTLSEEDQLAFWYFFLDGLHPNAEIPNELGSLESTSPAVYKHLVQAQENVLSARSQDK